MDFTREKVLSTLGELGFSSYEAKAYSALLEIAPANGYDVAKRSGVPTSKIYETLEKLVARGAAVPTQTENGAQDENGKTGGRKSLEYAPVEPAILLGGIKQGWALALEEADDALKKFASAPPVVETIVRILSTRDMRVRAEELIGSAEESLHVALWDQDFEPLAGELLEAVERGVRLALVVYTESDEILENLADLQAKGVGAVQHGRSKLENVPILGRQFVLVADSSAGITGAVMAGGSVDGAYTQNKGLLINAMDLVHHEIYLERILLDVREPVTKMYGENLEGLDAFDAPGKVSGMSQNIRQTRSKIKSKSRVKKPRSKGKSPKG